MFRRRQSLETQLAALDEALARARPRAGQVGAQIDRWRADAAALRFHVADPGDHPLLVAVLGGTGTGKSTVVNRLLDGNLTATSFRRTFTAGAVALPREASAIPPGWLAREHVVAGADDVPVRGRLDTLIVVPVSHALAQHVTLVDTPDLDGDQPSHPQQADRVFRWAQAVMFLVSPEKYQMPELLPYYRLAGRYALPALYVMNKCEEAAQLEDYAQLLTDTGVAAAGPGVLFAVPRDDAAWEAPGGQRLGNLRDALSQLSLPDARARAQGQEHRTADLLGRLQDQVIAPLHARRKVADRLLASLKALETPAAGVDVNPITLALQRRMQQKSVLYLMGPRRVLDRVRQVPGLLARLPRTTWDLVMKGRSPVSEPEITETPAEAPDFRATVADQFSILQSRIEDVVRSYPEAEQWIADETAGWAGTRIPPESAGAIADEELAALRKWLEERWNATPRDTMLLQKLLRHLPGGQRLTQWSEAAPYLLVIVTVMNNAFFGPIDLIAIGGYSLATWISERLSNEVTARTRQTNRRITDRFTQLGHEQIDRVRQWVQQQAPDAASLTKLDRLVEQLA